MKCGVVYQFSTPSFDQPAVAGTYAAQLDQIAMADGLGFDDIWLSEHHFTESNYLPSPLVMAGAVAMRTSRANVGIGIGLAPFYNPMRLAEDCAVADNLTGGRLMLGLGIGYRDEEYAGYGFRRAARSGYLEELIEVLRGAWSPSGFSYTGKHFSYDAVNCTPKPLQQALPIWVAGGSERAISRAARLGDGWFALAPDPAQFAHYRAELDAAGKDRAEPAVAALPFAWVYVSEDPDRDWTILGPHAVRELNLFAGWSVPGMNFQTVEDARHSGLVTVGTPDQIIEKLTELHRSTPLQRFVFVPNLRGAPVDIANRSLELFADTVLPAMHALDAPTGQLRPASHP